MTELRICVRCRAKIKGGPIIKIRGRTLCVSCFNIEQKGRQQIKENQIKVVPSENGRPTLIEKVVK